MRQSLLYHLLYQIDQPRSVSWSEFHDVADGKFAVVDEEEDVFLKGVLKHTPPG